MPKINWSEIQESEILVHRTNETLRIKFLDNGNYEMMEIKDKQTNKLKEIPKYFWKVNNLDDRENPERQREYSTLGSRLLIKLKEHQPLKNKSFSIHKFSYSKDEFDVDYNLTEIK